MNWQDFTDPYQTTSTLSLPKAENFTHYALYSYIKSAIGNYKMYSLRYKTVILT